VNETAELITKLLEEIVLDLAAVKNADMALHLALAMLQVRGKRRIILSSYIVNTCFAALVLILSLCGARV
jgi:acyl CoA:acetate/3-ketoacid CoA transferase alpha subunit